MSFNNEMKKDIEDKELLNKIKASNNKKVKCEECLQEYKIFKLFRCTSCSKTYCDNCVSSFSLGDYINLNPNYHRTWWRLWKCKFCKSKVCDCCGDTHIGIK